MASKFKPGIPDSFTFDVAPVADLGDYLDEQRAVPPVAKRGREVPARSPPPAAAPARAVTRAVETLRAADEFPRPPADNTDTPHAAPAISPPPPGVYQPAARARPPRHTGPRREINMTPETLRMADELLELIRRGSGQRDTKSSELFHALVLLAFEAREEFDPHAVPKRGRWGSPTARAYPLELKNALRRAVLRERE